ncbi:MAG: helix-hairpin-helix domain-containing protein [Candidatus Eremiobacteraeota bacterium]|nr:helix-hairpin-helix domain-containing protein [Candidatus Eremiobacteraeota bacterium]
MFSRIRGVLHGRTASSALIETGGLYYDVLLPGCVADKISSAEIGSPLELETFAYLQIDGNRGTGTYVGFTNPIEREFFEALLTVASIGPKTAVRAFSKPMAEIARFIDEADHASLQRLPGIGAQKAKDIVAKLQGKVARFGLIQGQRETQGQTAAPDFVADAIAVLLQLQYRRPEAERMVKEALGRDAAPQNAEDLLTVVYRDMARRQSLSGDAD